MPSIIKSIIKRLLLPQHLYQVIKLQRNRKKVERVQDDAQLKLYNKILPGDFLHYGYFANPNLEPMRMSLQDIFDAQLAYAHKLVALATDKQNIVLDVGCGMGGLLPLLNTAGFNTIALTPDNTQVTHIRNKYSNTVLHAKFEAIDATNYAQKIGTIITSESLQYLQLDKALPLIDKLLLPSGKWIACDYFRNGEAHEKSGHVLASFKQKLKEHNYHITYEEDITPHILPTIAYVHMWATQIGMPLMDFGIGKMQVKAPGFLYALQEALPTINAKIDKNIKTVDPTIFAAEKQYVLMVIEKVSR